MKKGKLVLNNVIDDKTLDESYKTLRTNLLYTSDLKTLMVTSTIANEGKTTMTFYLAKSYVELGKKVLLIDCDLRKRSLKKFFKVVEKTNGLSEYLSGQCQDYIYETDIENLDIVLSGKKPPNPTELLSADLFEQMLEELKKEYDLILIDTPPNVDRFRCFDYWKNV